MVKTIGGKIRPIKNCDNCIHLSWGFGDINDPEGYECLKRDYFKTSDSYGAEISHQAQLESDEYRKKPKRCCEQKGERE